MSLNFPNVSVLGLNREARFFNAGFEFASFKRISIAGSVNDLTETFGITGVWSGQDGLISVVANNKDYQPLILNGVNFGSGRIESINFQDGIDVRLKNYTANILVFDSGNLFNFTGEYYSGIDTQNFQYLNNFSENYSFQKKTNGGYAYNHNATITFASGANNLNAIQAAQNLAKTLFTGSNLGFAFYPGFTNKQGKRYITESYDLINNQTNFQERFEFDNNNGNYSAVYTNSAKIDENGTITATEVGNIRGIENPNYQKALSALEIELTGSYYRCSGVSFYYFPTGNILINSPISQSRSIDIFNNNISYEIIYDNSPFNKNFYLWNYTLQIQKQDNISIATEQGEVQGKGENSTTSFQNATSGFSIVKTGINYRCSSLFVSPYLPTTNYLVNKRESYSPVQGSINYSYSYSNDTSLVSNSGIRKVELTIDDNNPVYSYNRIGVINVAEILQNNYQSTQGNYRISVNMEGDKTVSLSNFLSSGLSQINGNNPISSEKYVGGANYSYDPNQNACNVEVIWVYNRAANQTIYP